MKTEREKRVLAFHSLVTSCNIYFRDSKGVPNVETTIHIGIRKRGKEFLFRFVNIMGGIKVKRLFLVPYLLYLLFIAANKVTLLRAFGFFHDLI